MVSVLGRLVENGVVEMMNWCTLRVGLSVISARALVIHVFVCYQWPCVVVAMSAPQRIFSINHAYSWNPE